MALTKKPRAKLFAITVVKKFITTGSVLNPKKAQKLVLVWVNSALMTRASIENL